MAQVLELANVTTGYASSTVVRDVSLAIGEHEIVALVGKNGMGKTSLLKSILGFLPAWRGSVHLKGRDITRLAPHHRRRLGVSLVPQEQALFQDLTVRENLRLGLLGDKGFDERLDDIAGWFPVLTNRLNQRAGT